MADDLESTKKDERRFFRPFTRDSLIAAEARITKENAKQKELKKKQAEGEVRHDDGDEGPQPDPSLEQGLLLPVRMKNSFPLEHSSKPLEDIDPFYQNKRTFIVISSGKVLFRFSATNALWLLNPFNPIRRAAMATMVHPLFALFIVAAIIINFILMTMPVTPTIENTEIIFTGIFTFELVVKILARGFILQPFTYLRDAWNWLDFIVLAVAYTSLIWVDIGNIDVLRTFRLLRALRTVDCGLRTIAGAVIDSVRNLCDVIILTIFSLSVFALLGLQIYMGVLTQKCVREFPDDGSWGNLTDETWEAFCQNHTNWYEEHGFYHLCGNTSGSGLCPPGYVCLQGYGPNPNYGYTSFDNFGWAFLSAFQLMTLDYWENLYTLVLKTAGPWHALFFIAIILVGSFYLINLILAIVAISYDKLHKRAEEEKAAKKALREMSTAECTDETGKVVKLPNDIPYIESTAENEIVDTKEEMVMNEIIEQPGRESKAKTHNAHYQEDVTFKNKMTNWSMKVLDLFCVWDCCRPWVRFQKGVGKLVFDPFFELFILLCILANTVFMALDHHDMDREMERVLSSANYFFAAIFVLEAILKIVAMSPKYYFKDSWNTFDFIVAVFIILELMLEGVHGLSILRICRVFRVIRVFKLAKSWSTLNLLISIMGNTIGALSNLTVVMCLIIFIFAVMGMQLFGKNYVDNVDHFIDEELPRWNFTDFLHSFMIVFRALCGEWIESMWDCMLVGDATCIAFFVSTAIIGNLVVVNLFLALLLSSFNSARLSAPAVEQESGKIAEAFDRIIRIKDWMTDKLVPEFMDDKKFDGLGKADVTSNEDAVEKPADCCCNPCYQLFPFLAGNDQSPFWQSWAKLRLTTFKLINNTYFESAVITVIVLSSLALTLEDIHLPERDTLQEVLYYMDLIFAVIFFVEMLIMWVALGFKKYFSDAWCWLDFIVVVVSLVNFVATLSGADSIQAFKTMRTLRALRPLRVMRRMQGMRVVVNALAQAIPSIFNVLLVCFIVWLIFAIIGVQLFAGKFFKCVDENDTVFNHEVIPNRNACVWDNHTWENSHMNFDHIGNAFLCLFQVATFKGWIQIMNDAIDSRNIDDQPVRETNIYMYLYFVIFIIFGTFFTLNLLVSVIIDIFNQQRKKGTGSLELFMTEDQKKYYNAMKKVGSKRAVKAIPRPKWRLQEIVFKIVTNKKFDMIIIFFIALNMIILSLDHYQQSEFFSIILDYLNLMIILVFSIECVLKIFALRYHYFVDTWNLFDFVVVTLSVLGLVLTDIIEKYFVSPTLLRVVRVARVGLVLRLVKGAKAIRTQLFTLAMSVPALFNICLVLFLVMFIYAIFGMSFFMHVKNNGYIDDVNNFKTFGQSMILLFQLSTTAGWDGVLLGIGNEEDCDLPDDERDYAGNCGSAAIGITYLLSYIVISFFIVIKMFVAVILENYSQATEDVQKGLTDDDYDMYYEVWQRFDPDGTQYIRYDQLSDFLDELEPPLRIHKPNKYKIVSMNIPICRDDMMFCVDVLDALTRDFFARKGKKIEENVVRLVNSPELQFVMKLGRNFGADYEPVSTTLSRQREEYCARLIQNASRRHHRDHARPATSNGHRVVLQTGKRAPPAHV